MASQTISNDSYFPIGLAEALHKKYPQLPDAKDLINDKDFIPFFEKGNKKLSIEEQSKIKIELSRDFKSKLNINYEYDPNLIAGLIIQIGSVMIDTSIKTKLKKLEQKMIEA